MESKEKIINIGYLINQYPKVSHSFIRREINALEAQGINVFRFAIRSCAEELVDEADKLELEKTRTVLSVGILGLLWGLLTIIVTKPLAWLQALKLAISIGWGSERGLLLHFAYLAEACVLQSWFAESEITHVHAHFGTNSTTVAMLSHVLGGAPYSFTVHGPEEFDKPQAIALPEKIKRAAFVVAVSYFGQSQLYRWCEHQHWSKIHVVHCGLDETFFNTPPQPITDQPHLVCVGRLSEQKGQLLLIQAAKQLADQGIDFKLILVGDGSLRQEIEELINQFGLQKQIEITGWASNSEVKQHILAARAMVLPSFAEGLPVVIMEALALARPVISTYVAGIPELVEPGVSGWLIPASSVIDLAQGMKNALESPVEQLQIMGKVGAEKVKQKHDIAIEAKKLVLLFQQS